MNTVANIGGEYSFVSQNMRLYVQEDVLERFRGDTDYDDIEDAILYCRFAHEYTHYFQNFTTTYGLLKTLISRVGGLGVLAALNKLPEHLIAEYRPIKEQVPKKPLRENKPWQVMLQLPWSMIQTLNFFEHNHLVEEHHLFPAVNKPQGMTTPAITTPRGIQKITAMMLMEYQALMQQVDFADRSATISPDQANAIAKNALYRPAIININSMICYALGAKKMSRPIHRLAYELITIALNPLLPENPVDGFNWLLNSAAEKYSFCFKYKTRFVWEDIHPGWRFFRLLEHLKSTQTSPPTDEKSVYSILQNAREHLEWQTPFDCLHNMLKNIEKTSLSFPELTADSQFRTHLIKTVWMANQNSLDACVVAVSDQILRQYGRGPLPSNALINPEACLLDEALSVLYSKSHECCVCYQETKDFTTGHRKGCPIPELFMEMRRHGHIQ